MNGANFEPFLPAPEDNPFKDLGVRLVKLGTALQSSSSTVSELVALAHDCGLNLRMHAVDAERVQP